MTEIRTALIGFGTAGRVFHAPLVAAEPRLRLDAVVTASPDRAGAVKSEYPDAAVLAGTDELFDRADDFDLVVIGSPNSTHAPLARRAIDAGLHVVIDKPIAVTAEEAESVVAAADARGVVLTVFQNRRWDGDFLTLRDVLASGELGTIHQFESSFEWFKPELGAKWKDSTIPEAGGGILYDLGPHLIDQAIQLFGDVVEMHAELDERRPGAVSDDDSFLTLLHEGGVRSRLWMSAIAPVSRARFRVVGSRAVYTSEGLDPQEPQLIAGRRPGEPGFGVHDDGRTGTIAGPAGSRPVPLREGSYLDFYRLLGDAIVGSNPPPVDPADSIRALRIIETATGR
jgi:predicted dehydrogenase